MAPQRMKTCSGCGQDFTLHGLPNHERKCLPKAARRQQDQEFEGSRQAQRVQSLPKYELPKLQLASNRGDTAKPESHAASTSTSGALASVPERHTLPRLGSIQSRGQGRMSKNKGKSAEQVTPALEADPFQAAAAIRLPHSKPAPKQVARCSEGVAFELPAPALPPT